MTILLIFITAASVGLFIFLSLYARKKEGMKKHIFAFLGALLLAVGLEVSLFNMNFFLSHGYTEISLNDRLAYYEQEDGTYEITGNTPIYFFEVYEEVKNIKIDLLNQTKSNVDVTVSLTDDANNFLFETPERTVNAYNEVSKYINVHTAGISKSLGLTFNLSADETVTLKGISVNAPRPFDFSLLRILLVLLIFTFIYFLKPSSPLYHIRITSNRELHQTLCTSLIILECGVIFVLALINPAFVGLATPGYNSSEWNGTSLVNTFSLPMENHNQYDELAQAILEGKTYIDNGDVPAFLEESANPYDTSLRAYEAQQYGESVRWDVAYFNGHYYVYFGIVPLLTLYLPFRLLFNSPFPSALGIILFAFLFIIGVYKFLTLLVEKKFKNTSLGVFLLVFLSFINSCGVMFLVKRPDFYSVPIIMGMTFTVWGLTHWLKGILEEKHSASHFFVGSLFMALVAGCRPQLLLISMLAIPVFFEKFFTKKELFKKSGIKDIVILGIPYIVVAAGLMYYNFIRFGSPTDFGSSYNLTTNDVTHRGFDLGRLGLGFFTYLFQTPVFTAVFPFIQSVDINTNYVGKTVTEACFGGLITSLPVLWFLAALPKVKNTLREKKLFFFVLLTVVLGFVLTAVDTEAGGLLQRYYSDFGFVFFTAVALIIFALFDKDTENCTRTTLLFSAVAISLFYSTTLAFSVSDVTIDTQNPALFSYLENTVQFWL